MEEYSAYSLPERQVRESIKKRAWYVKLARFICYPFILLWLAAATFSLINSLGKAGGDVVYMVGGVVGALLAGGLSISPLVSFLKATHKVDYRKYSRLIVFNLLAAILVGGLFFVFSAHTKNIYTISALICSLPYLLNAMACFALSRG